MRLDKYLADAGIGTRSQVKKLIKEGHIKVKGETVKSPECSITEGDSVEYDGKHVLSGGLVYYMFNKPKGCVCANEDNLNQTVFSYVPQSKKGDLFTIGRLDKDTTGLLIITNDGDLSHRMLSPRRHVDKVYEVFLDKPVADSMIEDFSAGLDIGDEKPLKPATLEPDADDARHCFVTISEGRYHQIKRMFLKYDLTVEELHRIRMGRLELNTDLKPGQYRTLTDPEMEYVKYIKTYADN